MGMVTIEGFPLTCLDAFLLLSARVRVCLVVMLCLFCVRVEILVTGDRGVVFLHTTKARRRMSNNAIMQKRVGVGGGAAPESRCHPSVSRGP